MDNLNCKVSVIIPNWNGMRYLDVCLNSLLKQTFKDFDVIVVDDASTDNSVKFVMDRYPMVSIIRLPDNKGFCTAVNEGIKNSSGEYIALLNNDTEVGPGWLDALYNSINARADVGFCASKILYFNNRNIIESAGIGFSSELAGFPIGAFLNMDSYDQIREVFGACACAAIYRRKMLDEIGLFDESFFMIGDDIDISFRAQLAGYRCLYVPNAIVYHHGSASLKSWSSKRVHYICKNEINVIIKNVPLKILFKKIVTLLYGQIRHLILYALKGRLISALKGKVAAISQVKAMWAKRRLNQRNKKVSDIYLLSIINDSDRSRALMKKILMKNYYPLRLSYMKEVEK